MTEMEETAKVRMSGGQAQLVSVQHLFGRRTELMHSLPNAGWYKRDNFEDIPNNIARY